MHSLVLSSGLLRHVSATEDNETKTQVDGDAVQMVKRLMKSG